MIVLSPQTLEKVRRIFSPADQDEVVTLLENDCGNNLPFLEKLDQYALERFRFAALKLSLGNLDKHRAAIELAKKDWRDCSSQQASPRVSMLTENGAHKPLGCWHGSLRPKSLCQ